MKNRYISAFVTSCFSILPIILIIYILSATGLASIGPSFKQWSDPKYYYLLAAGAAALILGLTFFQIGANKGLTKIGEYMGSSMSAQKNLFIVIIFSFALGALITCAEPSILIVADDVSINKFVLLASISIGVGIFVVIGIIRTILKKSLKTWYLLFYFIVFSVICLLQIDKNNHPFLPFIFDAGGITTGSATVPFILALGAGVASVRGGNQSKENSFGLVGLASIGPILTMTILILAKPSSFTPYSVNPISDGSIGQRFVNALLPDFSNGAIHFGTLIEVIMALLPIVIIFLLYERIFIKLSAKKLGEMMFGFVISYFGLVFFLTGVAAAMSPIGQLVGTSLAGQSDWIIILVCFFLGLVTILCEPAVHVLTTQMEQISEGQIKKKTVLIALSIGVGVAICLSAIRTLFEFSIMWYIVPGYIISILLMFVVPDIYTAMAFDSGGTASGPMAVSFILPMIIGIYSVRIGQTESVLFYENAFGVIAMIALTPIIAIQSLGLVVDIKNAQALRIMRTSTQDARNSEIIHF